MLKKAFFVLIGKIEKLTQSPYVYHKAADNTSVSKRLWYLKKYSCPKLSAFVFVALHIQNIFSTIQVDVNDGIHYFLHNLALTVNIVIADI